MSRIINEDLDYDDELEQEINAVELQWSRLQARWQAATDPAERQLLADQRDACLSQERYLRSLHSPHNPLATF